MGPKTFKIIIAGGGVAGLTLANILEAVGVDYVLLEAHSEPAPQVGASIGLWPYGLRILDQLGMYDEISGLWKGLIEVMSLRRSSDGIAMNGLYGNVEHMQRRHGYPLLFIDRHSLLEILARNIKQKNKVFFRKRISQVIPLKDSIQVKTQDGELFEGDILVGADGIHSTVRKEMWRIASEAHANCFPSDPLSALKCDWKCLFGMSDMDYSIKILDFAMGQDFNYLISSGPGKRVYWFLFVKIPSTKYGADIPRHTKEDEAELVKEHRNDRVSETMTFGDLYDNRTGSRLVSIEEHNFERWHYGRIVTIGDSAHKKNPIGGHGGNSSIESAAVLVNELMKKLKQSPGSLSDSDVDEVFANVQAIRSPRTKFLLEASVTQQNLAAQQYPRLKPFIPLILKLISRETRLERISQNFVGAAKLDMLDVPERPRAIPFHDELPAKPVTGLRAPKLIAMVILSLLGYLSVKALPMFPGHMLNTYNGGTLKMKYVGLDFPDEVLSILVSAFSFPLVGNDPATKLQTPYFLSTLTPVLMIWTIESYRLGHRRTPISLPIMFTFSMQLITIGRTAPIYFLLSILFANNSISYRRVPDEVAKAVLPATIIGYLIPTAIMLLPLSNTIAKQNIIAFWQLVPVYCAILTLAHAKLGRQTVRQSPPKLDEKGSESKLDLAERALPKRDRGFEESFKQYEKAYAPHLKSAYLAVFAICAISHIGTFVYLALHQSPELNLATVFGNLPNFLSGLDRSNIALGLSEFFKFDMWFYFASLFVYMLYTTWDLRSLGYVTNKQTVKAVLGILVGLVLVGPGAVYAGVWWWKETALAALGDGKMNETE